ncbi:MAG: amidase [Hyphomicrobiaceae bacterium]
MTDPADLGVVDAIASLGSGAISAAELTEACLARISNARGRALNAFIHVADAAAREAAHASDKRRAKGQSRSPLDGVPIAVKDNIDVAGMPTTNGLATHWMPAADAPVIGRLRAAGMVILGKLNMHEGALGATTDNAHHGRCIHPDYPGHTPGGSSGGSAAAVASGLCPVTLGTDTMGSVRLPAAYCGIVGFKPSRDYWPVDGVMPLGLGLDAIGPLAGSVADVAAVLDERIDARELQDVRFGRLDSSGHVDVEPACQTAFDAALTQLTAGGVRCDPVAIGDHDYSRARRAGFIVSEVDGAAAHARLLSEQPEAFSPAFVAMLNYGRNVSPERYDGERDIVDAAGKALIRLFDRHDVLIALTAPQCTFRFGEPVPVNQADLTAPANFAGCPAISLPLPVAAGQRPVGLQLVAPPGSDNALLSIAARVEAALMD